MIAGGGGGEDYRESEQSIICFSRSNPSHHLHRVNAKSEDPMEVLLVFLYERVDGGVSRLDMATSLLLGQHQRRGCHRKQKRAPEGVGERITTNPSDPSYPFLGPIYPVTCITSMPRGRITCRAC